MITYLVTGGIAGGKSTVCRYLAEKGFGVFDCDSSCKALYGSVPGLKKRIEAATGLPFCRLSEVFGNPDALKALEDIVYPYLIEEIGTWKKNNEDDRFVFVESAIALSKHVFDGLYDKVIFVDAPYDERVLRNPAVKERAPLQTADSDRRKADYTIVNNSTLECLYKEVDKLIDQLENEN